MAANGWRYRQVRDVADKAARRRIRRLGLNPESAGKAPHLSGARGVGPFLGCKGSGFMLPLRKYALLYQAGLEDGLFQLQDHNEFAY